MGLSVRYFIIKSEIFPLRVRAKGTSVATFFNWITNAVIAYIFPLYLKPIPNYTMYLIFGSLGMIMASFSAFYIPETMGKSLEDMDEIFGIDDANTTRK